MTHLAPAHSETLPDAPVPQAKQRLDHCAYQGDPRCWQEQGPQLGWRHALRIKRFLVPAGIELASAVTDVEVTHQGFAHHRCHEANQDLSRRPLRGELYQEIAKTDVPVVGLEYLSSGECDERDWHAGASARRSRMARECW